jgi:hypothetical protein
MLPVPINEYLGSYKVYSYYPKKERIYGISTIPAPGYAGDNELFERTINYNFPLQLAIIFSLLKGLKSW